MDSSRTSLLASKRHRNAWAKRNLIPHILLFLFLLAPSLCLAEWPTWIDNQKIRGAFDFSSVDKRAHFERLAASGINTLIVSFAELDIDKPAEIARMTNQADWCAELGLHLFVTMRLCGDTLESRRLIPGGRRYVDKNGFVLTKTPCPVGNLKTGHGPWPAASNPCGGIVGLEDSAGELRREGCWLGLVGGADRSGVRRVAAEDVSVRKDGSAPGWIRLGRQEPPTQGAEPCRI